MKSGKWSTIETTFLIENYKNKTDKEVAEFLDRNEISVKNMRVKLKLSKNVMGGKDVNCLNCDKTFHVVYSRKNVLFCSRKCKGEHQKNNSNSLRKCKTCGKEFYAKGNPKQYHIYCSKECSYIGRKNGKYIECDNCGKKAYKQHSSLIKTTNHFCCVDCANEYQKKDKIKLFCKVCNKEFEVYPSTIQHSKKRGHVVQYCSKECRDKDEDRVDWLIKLNNKQNRNKKRNKLEILGSEILNELSIEYVEQHLINGKITVDVYIPKYNLIIEWWGDYWHGHESKLKNGIPDERQKKRMALDISQSQYLKKCNYALLTFWEHEVKS